VLSLASIDFQVFGGTLVELFVVYPSVTTVYSRSCIGSFHSGLQLPALDMREGVVPAPKRIPGDSSKRNGWNIMKVLALE